MGLTVLGSVILELGKVPTSFGYTEVLEVSRNG